jgi:hypothetical protein
MNPWPEAAVVRAFLERAARRLGWIAAAQGAAAGLLLAVVSAAAAWWARWPIERTIVIGAALALAGTALRWLLYRRQRPSVARLVERRAPACRNLLVTAEELMVQPTRVRPYIRALVLREATRTVNNLEPAVLFPARRALAVLLSSAGLWALTTGLVMIRPAPPAGATSAVITAAMIRGVDVAITPPAYAGLPTQQLHDPARIEALTGSRVRLTVRGVAAAMHVETMAGRQSLTATTAQRFQGEFAVAADGYIAIEPAAADGRAGVRRLIGLSVTPDADPRVRITLPGRDLFLPDARRTIAVDVEAADDYGLAGLRLRYTRVSGEGEQFTFTDGEVPLSITRSDARTWTASGALQLDSLGLHAGDVLVYRGVALDRRPGARPAESDAFIIEITAPGAVAAEGFAIDDERDRYAISQQMVILKTERLIARRTALGADSLAAESLLLAAEQRQVRAEFVFMMGGELAQEIIDTAMTELNEEAEAEAEGDVLAGRLANRGRVELNRAIRSMSRASATLTSVDLDAALTHERTALTHLQGAFSRTRYILRALTERERLDLSRRLTGELTEARRDTRARVEAAGNPRITALRRVLSGIAALAGAPALDAAAATRASALAESVLQVDPSAGPLQQVATHLANAAAAISARADDEARNLLDRAATALAMALRADLADAPQAPPPSLDVRRLDGALADALRRAGAR